MLSVLILSAGGHAQVVADILLRAQDAGELIKPLGFLDDDQSLHGKEFLRLPVLGSFDALSQIPHDAIIIAVGDNRTRSQLAAKLDAVGERFIVAQHPTAVIAPDVCISPGVMICAGVVVNTGTVISSHTILNTGCTVDHHNTIGNYVHIAPGVHTGGEVVIEEGAMVGIGATVIPRTCIGEWANIGAGAVVTRSVHPSIKVVGVPAKPVQK